MLRKIFLGLGVVVVAIALMIYIALQDNPARPADGDRRVAHSAGADIHYFVNGDQAAPVVIIGHAYGNRVARSFASDYPGKSRGLILLAAGGRAPTPPDVSTAIMKSMMGIFPASTQHESVAFAFFAEESEVAAHWLKGWYPLAGLAQGGATANTPYDTWGSGGDDSIVILQPMEDAAAAAGAAALKRQFPQRVTIYPIEKAGHALLPEQPQEVYPLIMKTLSVLVAQ
jgi:pimeloyl-ACP methyl ester carboxylesterase